MSCAVRGSCAAAGAYADSAGNQEAMAVTQAHGRWRQATEIKPPSGAESNPRAELFGVACPAGGSCVAIGFYSTAKSAQALAVTESKGRWSRATGIVPPAGALANGFSILLGISCASAALCEAVGSYASTPSRSGLMAIADSKGRWKRAQRITAVPSNASASPDASLGSVSCTGTACLAVGGYTARTGARLALAIPESRSKWGPAAEVSLPANALAGAVQFAYLNAVDCIKGSCTAAGL